MRNSANLVDYHNPGDVQWRPSTVWLHGHLKTLSSQIQDLIGIKDLYGEQSEVNQLISASPIE